MSIDKPSLGTRVMWRYGRREYVDFGEIGTVTAHTELGYVVTMDDDQPFSKWCYGSKAKRTGHVREAEFTTDDVAILSDAYRENARRFRAIAEDWDRAAARAEAMAVKS